MVDSENPEVESENPEIPWHPKVSPYRLIVLATTIGLGTAKAVLTLMGSVFIPTTFEWVGGTAVFLVLFLFSPYDSDEYAPQYLSWLFEPDCMDLIWYLRAITFSIPRPNYRSDERFISYGFSQPPITTYRILLCSSVAAFGAAKAALGYLRFSTAATWIDWVIGVLATSIFYCLGLYERNSSNVWSPFFVDDQRQYVSSVSAGMSYTAGIAISVTWILYWTDIFIRQWRNSITPQADPDSHHPLIDVAVYRAFTSLVLEMVALMIAFGVLSLVLVLRLVAASIKSRAETLRAIRGRIFGPLLPSNSGDDPFFSPAVIPSRYIEPTKTFFRLCFHIALHLCALSACLTVSVLITGITTFLYDTIKAVDSVLIVVIFGIPSIPASLFTVTLWILDCAIVVSTIRPLFMLIYYGSCEFRGSLISP